MVDKTREKQPGDKTLVYMPFHAANSAEHIKSSKQWNNIDGEHDVICDDSSNKAAKLAGLTGPRDVLYIRGHCSAGSSTLESSDHTKTVSVHDIVNQLKPHLSTHFPGIIKLYGCETAENWSLWFIKYEAFAQLFANAMAKEGYTSCSFYGYAASVTTFPSGPGNHKWEVTEGFDNLRASAVRLRFTPNV